MYYLHNPHEQLREERALKQAEAGQAGNTSEPPTGRKKSIAQESGKGREEGAFLYVSCYKYEEYQMYS